MRKAKQKPFDLGALIPDPDDHNINRSNELIKEGYKLKK
jgi:hypothetical protein